MMPMASSREPAWRMTTTGPKISVRWIFIPGLTWAKTVGPMKYPFSRPGTTTSRPSSVSVAPSAIPSAMRARILSLAAAEMTGPMRTSSSA